jgi:isopenicillin N synthase-like dioxygenase
MVKGGYISLPTVDVLDIVDEDLSAGDACVKIVAEACADTGFLALRFPKDNGPLCCRDRVEAAAKASRHFFETATDADKASCRAGKRAYGYFPMQSEALAYDAEVDKRPDLREAFSMGPEHQPPPRMYDPEKDQHMMEYDKLGKFLEIQAFCYQDTPRPTNTASTNRPISGSCAHPAQSAKTAQPAERAVAEGNSQELPQTEADRIGGYTRAPYKHSKYFARRKIKSSFQHTLQDFYRLKSSLGKALLRVMALALDLPRDYFDRAARCHCNSAIERFGIQSPTALL